MDEFIAIVIVIALPLVVLAGTMSILIKYILSILRIFGMRANSQRVRLSKSVIFDKGWKTALWIVVFFLLLFIYCDIVLFPILGSISDSFYGLLMSFPLFSYFENKSSWLFGLLFILAVKSILLAPILLIIRGLSTDRENGKQPAKIQYFYGQDFIDLKNVIVWTSKFAFRITFVPTYTTTKWVIKNFGGLAAEGALDGGDEGCGCAIVLVILMILGIGVGLVLLSLSIIISIISFIMMAIMTILHSFGVLIVLAFTMYFSAMFYLAERFLMFIRSGYVKCPHAGCYASIALPVFVCPNCGRRHDRLIPGKYGVFRRTCKCGQKLSTLYWLGKGDLMKICPVCNKPLSDELFGGNIHLPIFGGPSSGKTMFRIATAWQLLEGKLKDIKASLIDESDRNQYNSTWKPDFETGRVREKTQEKIPNAFLMEITKDSGLPVSLYMYDPAGEAIFDDIELQGYKFLKYFDGLALLLDPLSFASMRKVYESKKGKLPLTASLDDPNEMINQIVIALEKLSKLSRGRKYNRRVAIVLTKGDDPIISSELGLKLSDDMSSKDDWSKIGINESKKIADWLSKNEPALYQQISTRFGDIRFFAVSSLGHSAEENKAFKPKQVLNPICWLLSKRRVLTHPRLTRLTMQIAEFSAVCATYLLFIGGLVFTGIAIASMII